MKSGDFEWMYMFIIITLYLFIVTTNLMHVKRMTLPPTSTLECIMPVCFDVEISLVLRWCSWVTNDGCVWQMFITLGSYRRYQRKQQFLWNSYTGWNARYFVSRLGFHYKGPLRIPGCSFLGPLPGSRWVRL